MSRTSDIAEVRSIIEKYIQGSGTGDAELLRSIFHKDAVMMGAMVDDAPPLLDSGADYLAEIVDIQVFGKAAIATLSEEGFFGMGFVDSFHLLNTDGEWKITSKVFNRLIELLRL